MTNALRLRSKVVSFLNGYHSLLRLCGERLAKLNLSLFSYQITSKTIIKKTELIRKQDVWDFEVPIYNNYFIEGVVNHNSGKTETGSGIVCEYAEKNPNSKIMCATVDYKTSTLQGAMLMM